MNQSNAIRFVIFKEDEVYVAVCLEHYIGAQGCSMDEVKQRLRTAYRATLDDTRARSGRPFDGIEPAPARYHEMWDAPGVRRGRIFEKEENQLELAA